ncbi:exocyst complex component exo84, partial [Spiromyces aspiralis]
LDTLRSVATREGIPAVRNSLLEAKRMAYRNWQRALHSNYDAFITISKEVSKIEHDLGIVQGFLDLAEETTNDLLQQSEATKETTNGALVPEPVMNRAARRRTARMSMFYEQNNAEQINKLCNKIERARKLLPFSPDRCIVSEFENVYELSPSNQQARQHAHIVLFNDVLLVAFYRRRAHSAKPVLLADKCFGIGDVVIDTVDTGKHARFIVKLSCHSDTLWFGFASMEKKRAFVNLVSSTKGKDKPSVAVGRMYQEQQHYSDEGGARAERDSEQDRELGREIAGHLEDLGANIACREFLPAVQVIDLIKRKLKGLSRSNTHFTGEFEKSTRELARLVLVDLSLPCLARRQ